MSKPDPSSPSVFVAADEEVAQYHAISSLAVAGLLAGLFSPLAMLAWVLWLVPLGAVVLSTLALRRIAVHSPELVGRPAALAGLLLGATFLVAAPVEDYVYRYLVRRQARQFAQIWIDAVQHGEVYKAHHLMVDPKLRLPLESELADFYKKNEKARRLLMEFCKEPTMRALFALYRRPAGQEAAKIRFYETADQHQQGESDVVQEIYAVTYMDERNQPKSFFIALLMQRTIDNASGRAAWTLVHVDGGVRPPGW